MRKSLWMLVFSIGLSGIIAFSTIFILKNEQTSQWILRQIASHTLPEQSNIKNIEGDFFSGFTVEAIDCQNKREALRIDNIRLKCSPLDLLLGTIRIRSLDIDTVSCTLTQDINGLRTMVATWLTKAKMPFRVALDSGSISVLQLRNPKRSIQARRLRLTGRMDKTRLLIDDFEAFYNGSRLRCDGQVKRGNLLAYEGRLGWKAASADPFHVEGDCTFNGGADRMSVVLTITAPFLVETSGVLTWNSDSFSLSNSSSSSERSHAGAPVGTGVPKAISSSLPHILKIENLHAKTLKGTLNIDGRVFWEGSPGWALTVEANAINPGARYPAWPGELSVRTTTRGWLTYHSLHTSLSNLQVDGQLLHQPIHAVGDIDFEGDHLGDTELRFSSGENSAVILSKEEDDKLDFNFSVSDPHSLWPPFEGRFTGKGEVSHLRKGPQVSIRLDGDQIRYRTAEVNHMHMDAQVNVNDLPTVHAKLKMSRVRLKKQSYPSVALLVSGNSAQQRVVSAIQAPDSRMDLVLFNEFNDRRLSIVAEKATLQSASDESWILVDPVKIHLDRNTMAPLRACWKNDKKSRCIQAKWQFGSSITISGDRCVPPFQFISDFIAGVLEITHKA